MILIIFFRHQSFLSPLFLRHSKMIGELSSDDSSLDMFWVYHRVISLRQLLLAFHGKWRAGLALCWVQTRSGSVVQQIPSNPLYLLHSLLISWTMNFGALVGIFHCHQMQCIECAGDYLCVRPPGSGAVLWWIRRRIRPGIWGQVEFL